MGTHFSATLLFFAIAFCSLLFIGASAMFGGHGHDHDGHFHDSDHDGTLSFFSPRVIAIFTLGFGAVGAVACGYGLAVHWASLIGVLAGFALAGFAFGVMNVIYKQQSSSLIKTRSAIGKIGQVTTAIPENGNGEIGVEVEGQYQTYLARTMRGEAIPKGARVKVVENQGGQLVVEISV